MPADELPDFTPFFNAYQDAALFTSNIEDGPEENPGPRQGQPFDRYFSRLHFTPQAAAIMRAHCLSFYSQMYFYIDKEKPEGAALGGRVSQAGQDFWLTSNGHGSGFWDGDWPTYGDLLSRLAKKYPGLNLQMTDDNCVEIYTG